MKGAIEGRNEQWRSCKPWFHKIRLYLILRFTTLLAVTIRRRGKEVLHYGNGTPNYLLINIYLFSHYINAIAGSDESQDF